MKYPTFSKFIVFLSFFALLAVGCKRDTDTIVPAWLYIQPIKLVGDNSDGQNTIRVTYALVFIDNLLLGAYNLPAKVPVLDYGEHTYTLIPGIEDNGIARSPNLYPFYEPIKGTVFLDSLQTDTIASITRYLDADLVFGSIETFEIGNSFTEDIDGNDTTFLTISSDTSEVAYGNRCGKITLSENHALIEVASILRAPLIANGTPVYIELDYKTDQALSVGLSRYSNGQPEGSVALITLFPSSNWNKIYINASNVLQAEVSDEYSIVFRALLPADTTSGTFLVDNVKLIYKQP